MNANRKIPSSKVCVFKYVLDPVGIYLKANFITSFSKQALIKSLEDTCKLFSIPFNSNPCFERWPTNIYLFVDDIDEIAKPKQESFVESLMNSIDFTITGIIIGATAQDLFHWKMVKGFNPLILIFRCKNFPIIFSSRP